MTHNLTPGDIRILLVEDDYTTKALLCPILKSRGFQVLLADNGLEGLELFRKHQPDIVLTDLMMPYMNGLEMARNIRGESPDAQIIVITAYSNTNFLLEAIDIGINQFVLKPVELPKFNTAIEQSINAIKFITVQRIQEAEELKSKKLEAIGILAGGMAHDFNNLLQVILGNITLAKLDAEPGSKVRMYLETAEKSSGQACKLSRRLLSYARGGEAFMQVTPLAPFITSGIEDAFRGTAITRELDLPVNPLEVKIDKTQIQQVITHLSLNALEAMPMGGTVRVKAGTCKICKKDGLPLSPGAYAHISFHDTGIGIPTENLGRIFDPYFTTKEMGSRKGTGLGLAICHTIIKNHNGVITAESQPGEGSTFHIYLPVADGEAGF